MARIAKTAAEAIAQLKGYIGKTDAAIRVNGLGERGLRWNITKFDDKKGMFSLDSADGSRECLAHPLDLTIAPITSRATSSTVTEQRAKPTVNYKG